MLSKKTESSSRGTSPSSSNASSTSRASVNLIRDKKVYSRDAEMGVEVHEDKFEQESEIKQTRSCMDISL